MISNRRIRKLRRWERVAARLARRKVKEVGKTELAFAQGKVTARNHLKHSPLTYLERRLLSDAR